MKALAKIFLGATASLIAMILFTLICVGGWFFALGFALIDWLTGVHHPLPPRKTPKTVPVREAPEAPIAWVFEEVNLTGAQPGIGSNVHPRLGPSRFQHKRGESSRTSAARRAKRRAASTSRCTQDSHDDPYGRSLARSWAGTKRTHRF